MTVTYHELKARKRRAQREELKQIELKLHPCPVINGYDILHEHKGKKIMFSAWKGSDRLNWKWCEWSRDYIYFQENFYQEHRSDLEWLTKEDK